MQDDNKDDPDPADDPGMPKAIALMLAPCFLILGLVLLWIGKTQGGFLSLILSVVALATGLIKSGRRR